MTFYCTTAYRYGELDGHSYIIGYFSNKSIAKWHGDIEESWRGGKYSCIISEVEELPSGYIINPPIDRDKLANHSSSDES